MFSKLRRKKILSVLLAFTLFLCSFLGKVSSLPVFAEDVDLSCKGAVLMEAPTGTVLFEKNPHKKLQSCLKQQFAEVY